MSIVDLLLPLAATAGGYMIKRSANEKADKQRASILQQMQAMNTDTMNKQVAVTNQQLQQYQPAQRIQALGDAEQRTVGSLQSDVVAPDATVTGPVYGGKVSNQFAQAKGQRTADELRYASQLASAMGKARAPLEVAFNEGVANADAATQRHLTRSNMQGDMNVQNLQLQSIEPNGGKMMAGDFLGAAGMMMGRAPPPDYGYGAPASVSTPSNNSANVVPGRGGAASLMRPKPGTTAYWAGGRR
jgi:hypothetical protein